MWDQIQEQDQPKANPARSDDSDCTLAGQGYRSKQVYQPFASPHSARRQQPSAPASHTKRNSIAMPIPAQTNI
uniref:Uncharacterized protein n=1 Tax=Arundo donax TaxID=35708 RepID=A0A0A9G779_ARUDO